MLGRVVLRFQLYIICKEMDEIVNFMFTPGNVNDREPLKVEWFAEERQTRRRQGLHQQRYLVQTLINGIQLIKLKNKMKNSLMSVTDKVLLRKKGHYRIGK
jgi:hypothetical protein